MPGCSSNSSTIGCKDCGAKTHLEKLMHCNTCEADVCRNCVHKKHSKKQGHTVVTFSEAIDAELEELSRRKDAQSVVDRSQCLGRPENEHKEVSGESGAADLTARMGSLTPFANEQAKAGGNSVTAKEALVDKALESAASLQDCSPETIDNPDNAGPVQQSETDEQVEPIVVEGAKQCDYCYKGAKMLKCVCLQATYCSKTCQIAHWKSHKPGCPPLVLKPAGQRGFGWFATRDIKPGQIVFREKAAIFISSETYKNIPLMLRSILDQFNALDAVYQNAILRYGWVDKTWFLCKVSDESLAPYYDQYGGKDLVATVIATFLRRKFICGSCHVLFLVEQLFNHSCAPNMTQEPDYSMGRQQIHSDNMRSLFMTEEMVDGSWVPDVTIDLIDRGISMVHSTLRKIEKGEELTKGCWRLGFCEGFLVDVSVDETTRELEMAPRGIRTKKLPFTCLCQICSLTGDALIENDEMRMKILKLYAEFHYLFGVLNTERKKFYAFKKNANRAFRGNTINDCFATCDKLFQLLYRIPDQLMYVRLCCINYLISLLPDALRAGQVPLMEPKEYKKELIRLSELFMPVNGLIIASQTIQEQRSVESSIHGGQYLHIL